MNAARRSGVLIPIGSDNHFRIRDLLAIFVFSKILTLGISFALQGYLELHSFVGVLIVRVFELSVFFLLLFSIPSFRLILKERWAVPRQEYQIRKMVFLGIFVLFISILSRFLIEWFSVVLAGLFVPEIIKSDAENLTVPQFRLGAVTIVPYVEEVIYRWVILYILSLRFRLSIAILVSSIIFAIFHENPIAALLGGMFFAVIYVRSGFLWPAVLAHAVSNVTVTIMYQFKPLSYVWLNFPDFLALALSLSFFCVLWFIIIIILIFKTRGIKGIYKELS